MVAPVPRESRASRRTRFSTLLRRLSRAGFKRQFVRSALLPEWWDETCAEDPNLLAEFEIRLARFLGVPLTSLRDSSFSLTPQQYAGAKLRHVRNVDGDQLVPAIHSAIKIAEATVRCLHDFVPHPRIPPSNGLEWRNEVESRGVPITLDAILGDLWARGIPVIPLEMIPAPSFQAMACIADGRPVILIGQKNEEPGRIAFWVAHEVGHIASGDCDAKHLVLDGQEGISDESDIEAAADTFSRQMIAGDNRIPEIAGSDFREIAKESASLAKRTGIGAGMIIAAWASESGDYPTAQMALKALYLATGARRILNRHFDISVEVEGAPETERELLRCVSGVVEQYETSGGH